MTFQERADALDTVADSIEEVLETFNDVQVEDISEIFGPAAKFTDFTNELSLLITSFQDRASELENRDA